MPGAKRLAVAVVLVLIVGCAPDPAEDTRPRGPLPHSQHWDQQFSVQLLYFGDADHRISSMTATGPGPEPGFAFTTVQLTWSSGTWGAGFDFVTPAGRTGSLAVSFVVSVAASGAYGRSVIVPLVDGE